MVRSSRKVLVGVVRKRSGDKSVKVAYSYKKPHELYRKEMKRETVVHVHDPENQCAVGDQVKIMSTRPLSHSKRWRLVNILAKASQK